ncbi:MAG: hypothetical protein JWM16_2906 [Verrucomicrobiales bacterium]|nr:hypothetical protein [Verrucomicrobiales bacterium]
MKTIVLSVAILGLALAGVQAGESKKAGDACCADKAKATAKAGCADKCCDAKLAKKIDMSVKGATALVQK